MRGKEARHARCDAPFSTGSQTLAIGNYNISWRFLITNMWQTGPLHQWGSGTSLYHYGMSRSEVRKIQTHRFHSNSEIACLSEGLVETLIVWARLMHKGEGTGLVGNGLVCGLPWIPWRLKPRPWCSGLEGNRDQGQRSLLGGSGERGNSAIVLTKQHMAVCMSCTFQTGKQIMIPSVTLAVIDVSIGIVGAQCRVYYTRPSANVCELTIEWSLCAFERNRRGASAST